MPKKQLSFFATRNDLIEVLEAVASNTSFCFSSVESQDAVPSVFDLVSEVPDLSIAIHGDINKEKNYLLISAGTSPKVRYVEQRGGSTRQIFDQLSHPESVVLKPGGVFGDFEYIVAGQLGTVSDDKWSADLYKKLLSEFKKRFKRVKAFYVGSLAMEKLESGVRLTSNIKSPPEYDLQL